MMQGDDIVGRPRVGDVLGGKFRIVRELGHGGMGVVYEVQNLGTMATCAIKWLIPRETSVSLLRRLKREAQITAALQHRHVVSVYDVVFDDAGSYMVMELLKGESLAERITREGALDAVEACAIFCQCLSALSSAHARGVVHRDIKPANIFLATDPQSGQVVPKLVDFGVSRREAPDCTDTRSEGVGSPAYMSPEQVREEPSGPAVDVYGIGVSLYEALAGRRAFQADSQYMLHARIVTGDAIPLWRVKPTLPAGLAEVTMRAMHVRKERRYASADELARALQPFAAPNAERRTRSPRTASRWLVSSALLGTLVLPASPARDVLAVQLPSVQVTARSVLPLAKPESVTVEARQPEAVQSTQPLTRRARKPPPPRRPERPPADSELASPAEPVRTNEVEPAWDVGRATPELTAELPSLPPVKPRAQRPDAPIGQW